MSLQGGAALASSPHDALHGNTRVELMSVIGMPLSPMVGPSKQEHGLWGDTIRLDLHPTICSAVEILGTL